MRLRQLLFVGFIAGCGKAETKPTGATGTQPATTTASSAEEPRPTANPLAAPAPIPTDVPADIPDANVSMTTASVDGLHVHKLSCHVAGSLFAGTAIVSALATQRDALRACSPTREELRVSFTMSSTKATDLHVATARPEVARCVADAIARTTLPNTGTCALTLRVGPLFCCHDDQERSFHGITNRAPQRGAPCATNRSFEELSGGRCPSSHPRLAPLMNHLKLGALLALMSPLAVLHGCSTEDGSAGGAGTGGAAGTSAQGGVGGAGASGTAGAAGSAAGTAGTSGAGGAGASGTAGAAGSTAGMAGTGGAAGAAPSPEQLCLTTGGAIGSATCCGESGEFPDDCNGGCSCSPENSSAMKACKCPSGECFDRMLGCTSPHGLGGAGGAVNAESCVQQGGKVSKIACCPEAADFPPVCPGFEFPQDPCNACEASQKVDKPYCECAPGMCFLPGLGCATPP